MGPPFIAPWYCLLVVCLGGIAECCAKTPVLVVAIANKRDDRNLLVQAPCVIAYDDGTLIRHRHGDTGPIDGEVGIVSGDTRDLDGLASFISTNAGTVFRYERNYLSEVLIAWSRGKKMMVVGDWRNTKGNADDVFSPRLCPEITTLLLSVLEKRPERSEPYYPERLRVAFSRAEGPQENVVAWPEDWSVAKVSERDDRRRLTLEIDGKHLPDAQRLFALGRGSRVVQYSSRTWRVQISMSFPEDHLFSDLHHYSY